MSSSRLAIYLNDHLAGATATVELARRAAGANAGTEHGELLARLAGELEEDRQTLREVMRRVDAGEDRLKVGAGWMAEKLGRLKLNGQLTGYSPLSRLVELEALLIGISGNRTLWRSLGRLGDSRLEGIDLAALTDRAQRQLEELDEHQVTAAPEALIE